MEIGIDSFASAMYGSNSLSSVEAMEQLLQRIAFADEVGLDVFGIGEHHKKEFLDSATVVILSAAAARTKRIRLTSAVTVLSAADPVRVYQEYATLDLISKGRAELVVGRGSSIEAYPLFGFDLNDYDALFKEKLDLLLQIRDQEFVTWLGKFRPSLNNLPVYPVPYKKNFRCGLEQVERRSRLHGLAHWACH
jgi:alkanesulfonate monooxygenase SsuD/methylene tetrahydromethanopterin reductase-like flavin-dependent oxidoreductase (luciferase family)